MKPLQRLSDKNFLIILTITIIGLLLRLWNLDKPYGLWFDEMNTYIEAKMPLQELFEIFFTRHIHTPLFYIILHFWMKIFGETDFIIRLLPVIFGVLTIPVIYFCAKELNCRKTLFLAPFFTAINSLLIYYSQEMRIYSLTVLFSSFVLLFLLRLNNNPNKFNITGLVLSNAGLLYTHTISFVFVFFEFLILGIYFFLNKRKSFKPFIYTGLLTFVLYSPYLYRLFQLISHGDRLGVGVISQWWSEFTFSGVLFVLGDFFSPFLFANINPPDNYFSLVFHENSQFVAGFLIFVCMPLLIGGMGIFVSLRKNLINILLFLVCTGFIAVFSMASMQGKVVYLSRYLLEAAPVFILLAIYGLASLNNKLLSKVLISLLLFLNLFVLFFSDLSVTRANRMLGFKPAAEILNRHECGFQDKYILIGAKKSLFPKYFIPATSGTFYSLHNWNAVYMPFVLSNEASFRDLTDIGFYELKVEVPERVKNIRKNLDKRIKNTDSFKNYKNHKNNEKFLYDYFRPLIADKNNIFSAPEVKTKIFSGLNKGNKLIIILCKGVVVYSDIAEIKNNAQNDEKAYRNGVLMYMLHSRIAHDLIEVAKQELMLENQEKAGIWDIYIFKKRQ